MTSKGQKDFRLDESLKVLASTLSPEIDLGLLRFKSTVELVPSKYPVGQDKAVQALEFGLKMSGEGFHIFVAGLPETKPSVMVKQIASDFAKTRKVASDLCFVNNFRDPARPHHLFLPAGEGVRFKRKVSKCIENLSAEIPKIFEGSQYIEAKSHLFEEREERRTQLLKRLGEEAAQQNIRLEFSQMGIAMIPTDGEKVLGEAEIAGLTDEDREKIFQRFKEFQPKIRAYHIASHQLDHEYAEKFRAMDQRCVEQLLEGPFAELMGQFEALGAVKDYLEEMRKDILDHFIDFLPEAGEGGGSTLRYLKHIVNQSKDLRRYEVNLAVSHEGESSPEVVVENFPSHANLVGRIERRNQFGVIYSDFTDIHAGALLRANGGFLLLQVSDLFRHPFSWDAIKRTLKTGELTLDETTEYFGVPTVGLRPAPIPIAVKVILIGSPEQYELLFHHDEDFCHIFKAKVEYGFECLRNEENMMLFARNIAELCQREKLPPFSPGAIAALLVASARRAEHRSRISLETHVIHDLAREASYLVSQLGEAKIVEAQDIESALVQRESRHRLFYERWLSAYDEGSFLLDLSGMVVGQVNGLSVQAQGDFWFGRPCRITARTFPGGKGVIDIQRESHLGGNIHSKGVMTLGGFLAGKFAGSPLSLGATLSFEQTYSEVEGDSASAAELVALLSSLSDLPVNQGLAITGSVNQLGEIQPVGGVNEKIEGFFDLCMRRGLKGQGVVIPERNIKNLVLKQAVVDAVCRGDFHIYAIRSLEQALELLMEMPCGAQLLGGEYLEDTIYYRVQQKITEFYQITLRSGPNLPYDSVGSVD